MLLFFPTFELTNEASERVEEEDVSTVKWLSGYVNAGRRQEHSEDIALRELEKNMRHCSKSISIDPLRQRHDLPIAAQCQRHTPPLTLVITAAIIHLSNKHNSDEKKIHTCLFYKKGTFFFCTNCKLNTVIILRVIIFDITFMNEHQKHVNK